ncbi:HNH endonuclease [Chryseobacterium cucumeris]|uniref:HNH endonuclease n=1 Tax=Chryseobacterium cucumeris TaxID=1813611 RepID=UPI00192D91E9|nr:HNH endonuclease signature motif containing protein [Chryseobacterium cucumeris]QRA41253.1 HNH endonuclease [Chryseobacterium cucumeris]
MINFKQISRIENDDLILIISEKNKPYKDDLNILKSVILKSYSNFSVIENNKRIKPSTYSSVEKKTLQSLYGSQTRTAKEVIRSIIDNLDAKHDSRCLYCGIGEYEEIDHYLPKEHFPEYSILFKNLIPICGKCNKIKGDKIPGTTIDYLHMTYDIIPLEQYLSLDITFNIKTPILNFNIKTKYNGSLIENHIVSLKLIERYNKKGVQYILRIKALYDQYGEKYAIEELERNDLETSEFYGSNFWKSVLIRKLKEINYIKDYCI